MAQDFPKFPIRQIQGILEKNKYCLLPTYLDLEEIAQDRQPVDWAMKKGATKRIPEYAEENLDVTIAVEEDPRTKSALEELRASRVVVSERRAEREAAEKREQDEKDNVYAAVADGTITECGCCYDELPMNRMVHCDGSTLHV